MTAMPPGKIGMHTPATEGSRLWCLNIAFIAKIQCSLRPLLHILLSTFLNFSKGWCMRVDNAFIFGETEIQIILTESNMGEVCTSDENWSRD